MVTRFEKFSYLISELSKLLHKIESDELEEMGLKGPHAIYILTIAKYKNGITSAKLSQLCSRDKADVSRAVGALIENGLAEKCETGGAKYKVPIVLTEKGYRLAKRVSKKAEDAVDFASRGISDEERKIFYDSLETICLNMQKMSQTGVPENND